MLLISIIFSASVPTSIVVSAQNTSISNTTTIHEFDLQNIVDQLSKLHPEFNREDIEIAVKQAANGQIMTLPKDKSINYSFRAGWQGITTGQLAFAINTGISLATGGALGNLASKLSSSALRSVRYSIQATLDRFGASWIGQGFIEIALNVLDPGSFIANSIDKIDTVPNNGRINLW